MVALAAAPTGPGREPTEVTIAGVAEPVGDGTTQLRTHLVRVFGARFVERIITWVAG